MSNYGEELAYWYLRFNGFFPITNYVLHKSEQRRYTSDCDVLAIRMPHVREDIGGHEGDWHEDLRQQLNFNKIVGIICEVKTGNVRKIFAPPNVSNCIDRLGFYNDASKAALSLQSEAIYTSDDGYQVAKLLIADNLPPNCKCIRISLQDVRQFIIQRLRIYALYKHPDRMFFNSSMLQEMIAANYSNYSYKRRV